MTNKEKMDAFFQGAGALAEQLGFKAFVVQIQLDETAGASTWWPGCPKDCTDPLECAASAFHTAAHVLMKRSDDLMAGKASVLDARATRLN